MDKTHQGKDLELKHEVFFLTATSGSIKSNWKAGLLILFIVTACFVAAYELISLRNNLSKITVSLGNYHFYRWVKGLNTAITGKWADVA